MLLCLTYQVVSLCLSLPKSCGKNHGQISCLYVPAKPGHTPACASKDSTFCKKIHKFLIKRSFNLILNIQVKKLVITQSE